MKIILGVFWKESMETLRDELGCSEYSLSWERYQIECGYHYEYIKFIKSVNFACKEASEIIFDLTHIRLDISDMSFTQSITINELHLVITTPEYLAKTRFFIGGVEQNKQEIVDKFIFQEYWNQYL